MNYKETKKDNARNRRNEGLLDKSEAIVWLVLLSFIMGSLIATRP